jgi:hypothetical protein
VERPRAGRLPRLVLAAVAAVAFAASLELTRYDHGTGRAFFWVAFVAAPVVVIFGAAAAGVRRWYGWPDLGPGPGRAALVASAVVLGVLVGTRVHENDVLATQARGSRLAQVVRAWRDAHGAWPARLDDLADVPTTRMGALRPPPFRYEREGPTLSFPIGAETWLTLDVAAEGAWRRR